MKKLTNTEKLLIKEIKDFLKAEGLGYKLQILVYKIRVGQIVKKYNEKGLSEMFKLLKKKPK